MYLSDATLRRPAWSMPATFLGLAVASIALDLTNCLPLGPDLALVPVFLVYAVIGTLVASRARVWLRERLR